MWTYAFHAPPRRHHSSGDALSQAAKSESPVSIGVHQPTWRREPADGLSPPPVNSSSNDRRRQPENQMQRRGRTSHTASHSCHSSTAATELSQLKCDRFRVGHRLGVHHADPPEADRPHSLGRGCLHPAGHCVGSRKTHSRRFPADGLALSAHGIARLVMRFRVTRIAQCAKCCASPRTLCARAHPLTRIGSRGGIKVSVRLFARIRPLLCLSGLIHLRGFFVTPITAEGLS